MAIVDRRLFQAVPQPFGFQTDFEESGQMLQGAFAVGRAVLAVDVVYREKQLQCGSLQTPDGRRIGSDHHRRLHRHTAGGNRAVDAVDLHEAQSAGGRCRIDLFQVTQVGNA